MRNHFILPSFAAYAALISSTPTTTLEPCAQVSAAVAALSKNQNSTSGALPYVDADMAMACLRSVPLDKAGDLKQLHGMREILNFQSDLSYLKDPTPGYLYPPVDVLGSIDAMISKLEQGGYNNEYDLQLDLYDVMLSGYDFHLRYTSDILYAISWVREGYLISVSLDGKSLPQVFNAADLAVLNGTSVSDYTPSPVTQINGTDVEEWLNQYAALNPWDHDPDANYNNLFYRAVGWTSQGRPASFTQPSMHFPGSITTLTFANGTTRNVKTGASVQVSLDGVTDGASFFKKVCDHGLASLSASGSSSVPSSTAFPLSASTPGLSSAPTASASATISSAAPSTNNLYTPVASALPTNVPTYGQPIVLAADGSISGYFPKDQSDLAVIVLPTFEPAHSFVFQNLFRSFLATAKSLHKTKLILDIRGNGGGIVVDGFSLFKQLFPSKTAFGGSNLAAWPLLDGMGQSISALSLDQTTDIVGPLSELNIREDLDVHDQPYASWSDFFGPVQRHGGEYTNIRRYNFSDPNHNGLGEPNYGYINDSIAQPQTFASENIVILSDALCGSTCAIFSELLKTQANVQAIAVGGRPQYCPMQSVGGSKGSNDQQFSNLFEAAKGAIESATTRQEKAIFKPYLESGIVANTKQVLARIGGGESAAALNFQNNLRRGDDTFTPLQFVYEAANCRFFYTPQMVTDQSLVWQKAYSLRWGNETCPSHFTSPSSQTGTDYITSPAPTCARNFFGADIDWSYPGAYKGPTYAKNGTSTSTSAAGPGYSATATSNPNGPPPAVGVAVGLSTRIGLTLVFGSIVGWMLM